MKILLALAACTALLQGCSPVVTRAPALVQVGPACQSETVHFTVVGDSLARGWGASHPQNTFAALTYDVVRQTHPQTTMRNLGIPGATSDEIAFKEVPQIHADRCSLIAIVAGANDVQKLYTPRHFRASYATLLRKIRLRVPCAALIVVGLPDVALSPRIPWILKPYESMLSRAANTSITASAQEYGAAFVPLYDLSENNASRTTTLLSKDGIHPNDAGYRIMASAAAPAISTLLQQGRAAPSNSGGKGACHA